MKKKDTFRNFLPYLPAIGIIVGVIVGYVNLQADTKNNKSKVEKLETDTKIEIDKVKTDIKEIATKGDEEIKEIKDDNKELETAVKVNKTQQDNMQAQIQQISEKTDKIVDLLIEIKQKKK